MNPNLKVFETELQAYEIDIRDKSDARASGSNNRDRLKSLDEVFAL